MRSGFHWNRWVFGGLIWPQCEIMQNIKYPEISINRLIEIEAVWLIETNPKGDN